MPEDTAPPYTTFFFPGETLDRNFSEKWDGVITQFTIVSNNRSASEKNSILANLISWFDNAEKANGSWAALTVSGYTVVSVDRLNIIDLPYDSEEGENIITVDYNIDLKS